jgi:hypothetical protein
MAAPCRKILKQPDQLDNMIAYKEGIYKNLVDQTQEESREKLLHSQQTFTKEEVEPNKKVYIISSTGQWIAENSASMAADKQFKKWFLAMNTLEDLEKLRKSPNTQNKADAGTKVHSVAQLLGQHFAGHKTISEEEIKQYATNGEFKMPVDGYLSLKRGVKRYVNDVKKLQEQVDPEGEVDFYFEQVVIDPYRGMGGTIDFLAVLSDNTAVIYDYKTFTPGAQYVMGKGKERRVVTEDYFAPAKRAGFKLQATEYRDILMQAYGIKEIRQTRVLPVHIELETKTAAADRDMYNKVITTLNFDANQNENLLPLPLDIEISGYTGLDEVVSKKYARIKTLNNKLDRKEYQSTEQRERIIEELRVTEAAVKRLQIQQDVSLIFEDIKNTIDEYEKRRAIPMVDEDGKFNEKYVTLDELNHLYDKLKTQEEIIKSAYKYTAQLRKEKKIKKSKEVEKVLDNNTSIIQKIRAEVLDKIEDIVTEDISNMYKDVTGKLKPLVEADWVDRNFGKSSSINDPLFREFWEEVDRSKAKTNEMMIQEAETIQNLKNEIIKWAKASGMKETDAYKKIINHEDGYMYGRVPKSFWTEDVKAAREAQNTKWMKEKFTYRDKEAWEKWYSDTLKAKAEALAITYRNLSPLAAKSKINSALNKFKKDHNLNSDRAWIIPTNQRWLKLKPEVAEQLKTPEFKYIEANKPLMDMYLYIENKNKEFREMLGQRSRQLPDNFFGNIRQNWLEMFQSKSWNPRFALRELVNSLSIREDDYFLGMQAETGNIDKAIPVMYMNNFTTKTKDGDSVYDKDAKTIDIPTVMVLFSKMAYNHKHMTEIQSKIYAIRNVMSERQLTVLDKWGKPAKEHGRVKTRPQDESSKMMQLFDKYMDFYLFGIKYKEQGISKKIAGREFNSTKVLLGAKELLSLNKLGLAMIPAAGAALAGTVFLWSEAIKGRSFNMEQRNNSAKLLVNDRKASKAFVHYFDTYTEDISDRLINDMTAQKLSKKWLSKRKFFMFLRTVDENIDDLVTMSIAQNYGINEQGNIMRKDFLPEGTDQRSIHERFQMKNGKVFIEGLTDEATLQFRRLVKEVSLGIKGAVSADDIAGSDLDLAMSLAMQFKTWMPGLAKERFGELKFNKNLGYLNYGKYRAALFDRIFVDTDTMKDEFENGNYFLNYTKHVFLPETAKLIGDIVLYAPFFGNYGAAIAGKGRKGMFSTPNEKRVKVEFQKWIVENPEMLELFGTEEAAFEHYMETKVAAIKSGIAEFRAMLGMYLLVALLGGAEDGEEPLYESIPAGKNMFQVLAKAYSEVRVFMDPSEFVRLAKNPFPIAGLLVDVQKMLRNTVDESIDFATGEDSANDKSPPFYYSLQFVRGWNQLNRVFDFYDVQTNPTAGY